MLTNTVEVGNLAYALNGITAKFAQRNEVLQIARVDVYHACKCIMSLAIDDAVHCSEPVHKEHVR